MKRTSCLVALTVLTALALAGFAACDDGGDAALRGGSTKPRDASPRPVGDGAPVDPVTDASVPADASSSSSSSSSSGAVDLDADLPDAEAVLPGYCRVSDAFGVSLPVAGLDFVTGVVEFSITPDERTIAWVASVDGGTVIRVAARATESASFGAPADVEPTDASFDGTRGLALSGDGLHLVLVSRAGDLLAEVSRPSLAAPFSAAIERAPYSLIEPDVVTETGLLGWPVFGREDRMLSLARIRPSSPAYSVLVAERLQVGDSWPLPSPRTEGVLAVSTAGSSQAKTVTGISVDGLTVFVRNEVTRALFAVNRPNDGATFEQAYSRPVAAAHAAMPSAACDRLYVLEDGAIRVRRVLAE